MWEIILFIKNLVRSFIEVRHYCWLCFHLYLYHVYVCGCTTLPCPMGWEGKFWIQVLASVYKLTLDKYILRCLYNTFIFGACGLFAPTWHNFEPKLNDDQRNGRRENRKQNATLRGRTRHKKKVGKWRDRGKNKEKCNRLGERKPEQTNNEKQKIWKKKRNTPRL